MTKRVVIIETEIKQYRARLMLDLAARLRAHDVELKVVYCDPSESHRRRADAIELEQGVGIKVPALWLLGDRVVLHHAWPVIRHADLVITEQSNKILLNLVLLSLSRLGLKQFAYWGHGYNRQATRPGLSENFKRRLVKHADWWFAYTDGVKRYLVEHGVPPNTITTVQNTIDTAELTRAIEAMSQEARMEVRAQLRIKSDARIGLFCGALTPEKELGFLLEATNNVRERVPGFELIIVGDGPSRALVEAAARTSPHVHYVGAAFSADRARYFAIADLFVMPALVGLAIVDAFAAALPILTTSLTTHGPEIEYLDNGFNGVITEHHTQAFASAIAAMLQDADSLSAMRVAAAATAQRLTLSHMVAAFETGILSCLGQV